MSETRYFAVRDQHGLNANGNPEPLVEIGVTIAVPVMKGGEIIEVAERLVLKPLKGSRTVSTDDPRVAAALDAHPALEAVDKPSGKKLQAEVSATEDSRREAGTIEPANGKE